MAFRYGLHCEGQFLSIAAFRHSSIGCIIRFLPLLKCVKIVHQDLLQELSEMPKEITNRWIVARDINEVLRVEERFCGNLRRSSAGTEFLIAISGFNGNRYIWSDFSAWQKLVHFNDECDRSSRLLWHVWSRESTLHNSTLLKCYLLTCWVVSHCISKKFLTTSMVARRVWSTVTIVSILCSISHPLKHQIMLNSNSRPP